jgi:hypothetical protein
MTIDNDEEVGHYKKIIHNNQTWRMTDNYRTLGKEEDDVQQQGCWTADNNKDTTTRTKTRTADNDEDNKRGRRTMDNDEEGSHYKKIIHNNQMRR